MTTRPRTESLVDRERLQPIPDLREWYPELGFAGVRRLGICGESVVITDPTYLANVYQPSDDAMSRFVRSSGVIVCDFGGDTSCPVWWTPPHLILPTSSHLWLEADSDELVTPSGVEVLAQEVGCDSSSFVFLPMRDPPGEVQAKVDELVRARNAAVLVLAEGTYEFYLEQYEPPSGRHPNGYRNIVAERT